MHIRSHLVCTLVVLGACASGASADEWVQRLDEHGIVVHTRPVEGSSFQAFRGRSVVSAPLDRVLAIVLDADGYQDWFPDCPESRLLRKDGNVQLHYAVTAAPWPVEDRDAVYEYTVSPSPEAGSAFVRIGSRPEAYPEQDSIVRIKSVEGSWSLRTLEEGRTEVIFEMHLEPGGNIPSWLANARVVDTPKGALTGLAARLAQP